MLQLLGDDSSQSSGEWFFIDLCQSDVAEGQRLVVDSLDGARTSRRERRIRASKPRTCVASPPHSEVGENAWRHHSARRSRAQPLRAFSVVTFAICMLVLIADGMDAQLLGIVVPIVVKEFATDNGTFGIAVMAALVGFGLVRGAAAGSATGSAAAGRWRSER
jgi:hypothetical protein